MKRVLIFLCISLVVAKVFAYSINSRIIEPQSEVYDYMDSLYALNNKAKPDTDRPWSESEARLLLDAIDKSKQTGVAYDLYKSIEKTLENGSRWVFSDGFGLSVLPEINLEAYGHSNTEDFTKETQFVRSYADRKPWVKLNLDFSVNDFFWLTTDIMWKTSRGTHKDTWAKYTPGSNISSYQISGNSYYPSENYYFKRGFGTNFNLDTYDFSFIWPHRAITSVGGKNWNVSLNRDRMKIGDAHFGNLLVDDYSDYNDYLKFSFFTKNFKYNWYMMFLNTLTSDSEEKSNEARMFLIHTADFRVMDRINLKVSENVMYKYSTLDLAFLNPAFIYHNLNNRSMFNALAYVEANVSLLKGVSVYGQFALDQARAPNEDYSQADSSGLILGIEHTASAFGGVLHSYVEAVQTAPCLYRRDKVDFVKVSRYYHQDDRSDVTGGLFPVFEYIGFPFGGDAQVFTVGSEFTKPGYFKTKAYASLIQLGGVSIFTSHNIYGDNNGSANIPGKSPSGDVITRAMVVSASGELDVSRFVKYPQMSLMAEVNFVSTASYTKATKAYSDQTHDVQVSVGSYFKF